jgi:BASS family bile acid:Na+ symporter
MLVAFCRLPSKPMARSLAILIALTVGALLPQLHVAAGAIPWLVAVLLLPAFAGPSAGLAPRPLHLRLLIAAPLVGALACAALWRFDRDLAIGALLAGAAPTATAAPVVVAALGGDAAFAASAVLISNLVLPLLVPGALRLLLGEAAPLPLAAMFGHVALVVGLPLVAARLARIWRPAWADGLVRMQPWSFILWVGALVLVAAQASYAVRSSADGLGRSLVAAGIAGVLCLSCFLIGRRLGGRAQRIEGAQGLGQKNTALAVWMAGSFAGPVAALVPTWYILCHNLANAGQMARRRPSGDSAR